MAGSSDIPSNHLMLSLQQEKTQKGRSYYWTFHGDRTWMIPRLDRGTASEAMTALREVCESRRLTATVTVWNPIGGTGIYGYRTIGHQPASVLKWLCQQTARAEEPPSDASMF